MAKRANKRTRGVRTTRKNRDLARVKKRGESIGFAALLKENAIPLILSLCILACLSLVLAFSYGAIASSHFFDLGVVEVKGTERASKSDIEKIVRANAEKSGVLNADLLEIKQKIEKVTFVKAASVARRLPAGVSVSITERKPVAIVRLATGDYLADEEGEILAPAQRKEETLPFAMIGWDDTKSEKAWKDNVERLKIYQKMLTEWKDYDLAERVKLVDLADLKEPRATLEDSGFPVNIMLGRENFGPQLASGIKAIVGKGNMFEGVELVGPNMRLVPRKRDQQ